MANGNIIVKILGDDSHFKRTVSGLGKAAGAAVKGLAVAGGVLAAAWSAVGVTSVKYNAEVEQLQTSFEVMTGSAGKAASVMERLRKLGATTPFATKDLASATQLLMQYGFNADDAIDRMSMLGDIAQGDSDKMMRIAAAYGQMSSAGKVSLEDVKQMIEAGFNPLLEISESTGESMESLYDRISKGTLSVNELTDSMRRATSEGGKFFGSMEAQSQTVSGLLSSLQDELQTLGGSIFEPISEALRTKVLPEAIRIVQAMQDAYADRGWDGLIDSLTAEIPKLLDAATAALEKLAGKLKTKLPGVIKKLISALPSVLASVADSILPTLVDTIFEVIAVAVEELVGRLPELVPILLRGVLNLVKSVASGIWNVVTGLFDGLDTAMKKMGMLSLTPLEAFEQAWANTDTSQYKNIDVTVGAEVTVEGYQEKIDAALSEVRTALNNIPGLSEDQRNAIETAIINGTGIDLIEDTLLSFGVDSAKVGEITGTIKTAKETIETTLIKDLGLDDIAVANITALAAEGGNVKKALEEDYGIDPTKAEEAAGKINTAMGSIETAVEDIGLTPTQRLAILQTAGTDRNAVEAALLLMGIDPAVIDPVLASYDTISGSLTARANSVFDQIATEFTNGVPESDAEVQEAKDAVTGLFKAAYERVELWRQEALKDLESKGLTGDALAQAVTAVNTEAQGMIDELNRLETEAMTWTEENANRSTAFVKGNLDELDSIVSRVTDISARIDGLTGEAFTTAKMRSNLVKAGAVSDVSSQVQAFQVASQELETTIEDARTRAGDALDEAVEEFAGDADGYAKREKEIFDQLASEEEAAYANYDSEIAQIISGIVKASPELTEAFSDFNANQAAVNMATTLQTALSNAVTTAMDGGGLISIDDFLANMTAEGVDMSVLAENLGITPEELVAQIDNALKNWDDTQLSADLGEFVGSVEDNLSTALMNAGINAEAIPAFKTALESGYLQAAGEIDWTNLETILNTALSSVMANTTGQITAEQGTIETAISDTVTSAANNVDSKTPGKSIGGPLGDGMIVALKQKKGALAVAMREMIRAAVAAGKDEAGIASPSKVTREMGRFFGDGFALGIDDRISSANRAAQRMAESAIGTIDAIGNNMSISQQVNAGGMASAFQTMLAGMNLATDNGQPVQLFINGRLVAETIKRDIAQTQAGYNMDLARGVGKA